MAHIVTIIVAGPTVVPNKVGTYHIGHERLLDVAIAITIQLSFGREAKRRRMDNLHLNGGDGQW
jgi:hypothetical protein